MKQSRGYHGVCWLLAIADACQLWVCRDCGGTGKLAENARR